MYTRIALVAVISLIVAVSPDRSSALNVSDFTLRSRGDGSILRNAAPCYLRMKIRRGDSVPDPFRTVTNTISPDGSRSVSPGPVAVSLVVVSYGP